MDRQRDLILQPGVGANAAALAMAMGALPPAGPQSPRIGAKMSAPAAMRPSPQDCNVIDLYTWPTPNGLKLRLFLEEVPLPHRVFPIDIGKGEQFQPDFLAIAPNNRIPALVDHEPADGGGPLSLFESGAMLVYLAEKSGQLLPTQTRARAEVLQWLFWQVGGLGPMAGQNGHFNVYAPEKVPYAIDRYRRETARLYGVLDRRLADRQFIAGDAYSIADIACYPWIVPHAAHGQDLADFPQLRRWFEAIRVRPATQRTYADVDDPYARTTPMSEAERAILFGTAAVRSPAT